MRDKFLKRTIGYYYRAITLIDTATLIICFFQYFSQAISQNIYLISDEMCKISLYLVRIFPQMSSWIDLFLTIDRLLSIKLSRARYESKKFIISLINVCSFAISVVNIPNLWFSLNYNQNNRTNQTIVTCVAPAPIVLFLRDFAAISFRTAIPFLLIFLTNSLLIRYVLVSKRQFKNQQRAWRRKQDFAFSIIVMNIFFLINLLPVAVTIVLFNVFNQANPTIFAGVNLATFIAIYFSLLNHSCAFLINLYFNKLF